MDWKNKENKRLIEAFLTLKDAKDAECFLRDLMTEKEIKEFSLRLKTAEMLAESIPYSVIEKETGLSSTTVARVAKWLKGSGRGYKTVIGKLHHHTTSQLRKGLF